MTAKGDTVVSGSAMTNYITKNFRADLVVVHHLSEGMPPNFGVTARVRSWAIPSGWATRTSRLRSLAQTES